MKKLAFSYQQAQPFLASNELNALGPAVRLVHDQLHEGSGPGSDYLGWLDLPNNFKPEELAEIKTAAANVQQNSDLFIVIGVGGSYLGARAAIEALSHSFYNLLTPGQTPQIIFAGHTVSSNYWGDLIDLLKGRDFSLNVISKSGTTTEPALAFRALREILEDKYGEEKARERIYVTTDKSRGILRALAREKGYQTFPIPRDIGGRFSVLTAVGLLPIAVAGIDIEEMMAGAKAACREYSEPDLGQNQAYQYAALRNVFQRKGKAIEILVNYEPSFQYFNEWWKQLFGESEGKDQKGLFPASVNFTTDLHSLGQFIQDGTRNIFATTLWVKDWPRKQEIKKDEANLDGLNYLAGKTLDFVNYQAFQGTVLAHTDGGVPNLVITIPVLNAYYYGALVYFFEKACAVSGYLLGVNPFDQPGVEAYKANMFALLGKPGFEARRAELIRRIK